MEQKSELLFKDDIPRWKGEALARVQIGQQWKLKLVADLKEHWQVEAVMEETREWKVILLGKDLEDWKFQMLLSVDEEETGIIIEKTKSRGICQLLVGAEESWRLNALVEAAAGGFWLAELVSMVKEEWQARLLLRGHKDREVEQ